MRSRLDTPLDWVNAPRQARSQKTLARILDAAEAIIRESGIDALTIPEVVRRAESSVGSFYARFPDKSALLSTLHERACEQSVGMAGLALAGQRASEVPADDVVRAIVRFSITVSGARSPILHAFAVAFAGDAEFATRRARTTLEISSLVEEVLLEKPGAIRHPRPREAVRMGLRVVTATLEQRNAFHSAGVESVAISDEELEKELVRMLLAYLGILSGTA